jgi:homoserine O-acetyltransferase/O-succinyltransferase
MCIYAFVKDPMKAKRNPATGPASISPDIGKPYGMSFPLVGINDFVRIPKALLKCPAIRQALSAFPGDRCGHAERFLIVWLDVL